MLVVILSYSYCDINISDFLYISYFLYFLLISEGNLTRFDYFGDAREMFVASRKDYQKHIFRGFLEVRFYKYFTISYFNLISCIM